MKKKYYFYTNLLAWGLVLLLAGNYVFGWVTPTLDPPEGDLSAPLDQSSTAQTKTGDLTIDSLLKVGRYSSAPTGSTGALYYDTTENEFKGYKASSWDSLGGTAPVSSVFGRTGAVTAVSGDYLVGNITGAAPLASPTFTGNVTVPTPTAGTDAATKAYVDAAAPLPGFLCPSQIESSDRAAATLANAITTCRNLGNSWRLPAAEELACFIGAAGVSSGYLWTRTPHFSTRHYWVVINLTDGHWNDYTYTSSNAFRCVR